MRFIKKILYNHNKRKFLKAVRHGDRQQHIRYEKFDEDDKNYYFCEYIELKYVDPDLSREFILLNDDSKLFKEYYKYTKNPYAVIHNSCELDHINKLKFLMNQPKLKEIIEINCTYLLCIAFYHNSLKIGKYLLTKFPKYNAINLVYDNLEYININVLNNVRYFWNENHEKKLVIRLNNTKREDLYKFLISNHPQLRY